MFCYFYLPNTKKMSWIPNKADNKIGYGIKILNGNIPIQTRYKVCQDLNFIKEGAEINVNRQGNLQ